MGNTHICQTLCNTQTKNKKLHQITFLEQDTRPQGSLTPETIQYLTELQLQLFKISASSNTLLLKHLSSSNNPKAFDSNRTSLLHVACRSGALDVVEYLLGLNCDANLGDINGETPMHIAARFKREAIVGRFFELGGNPYIKDRQNNTVYQLLNNQRLKRMMSQNICNSQFQTIPTRKDDTINAMENNNQIRSIGDVQQIDSTVSEAEDQKDILKRRESILKLSSDNAVHKIQRLSYNVSEQLFVFLSNLNPKWGTLYLLSSRDCAKSIILKNIKLLKSTIFECLTNVTIPQMFRVSTQVLKQYLFQYNTLSELLKFLFQEFIIHKDLFRIHVLCWLVTVVKFQQKTNILKMDLFHKVLFSLIVYMVQKPNQYLSLNQMKSILSNYSNILRIEEQEIQKLVQFCQNQEQSRRKTEKKQKLGQVVTLFEEQGRLIQVVEQGMIFYQKDKAIVFHELLRQEYQGVEVTNQKSKTLQQRFKFSITQ